MKKNLIFIVGFILTGIFFILIIFNKPENPDVALPIKSESTTNKQPIKSSSELVSLDESFTPEDDPYAGISSYEQFKNSFRVSLYEQFEDLNFEEAYQAVFDHRDQFKDQADFEVFLKAVLKNWGKHDPVRVLEIITDNVPLDPQEIPSILNSVAIGLAKQDSRAAFEWLEDAEKSGLITDEVTGDIIYTSILREHAKNFPEEVIEIFHEIELEGTQLALVSPILESLTAKDLAAATKFIIEIENSEVRGKALEGMLFYNKDPKFLVDSFLDNQELVTQDEIALTLDKLAETDYDAAEEALLSAEGVETNEYLLTRFASSQAKVDGERLQNLVEGIEDPKVRDNVVGNVAASYTDSNVGMGISVANDIKDDELRISTILNIIEESSHEQIQQFKDYFDEFSEMPTVEKGVYLQQLTVRLSEIEEDS